LRPSCKLNRIFWRDSRIEVTLEAGMLLRVLGVDRAYMPL
jgi:hypothetical protein